MIKNRKEQSNSDGACAACYCGAYMPIDGAYYSDAAMYDAGKFNCELIWLSKCTQRWQQIIQNSLSPDPDSNSRKENH